MVRFLITYLRLNAFKATKKKGAYLFIPSESLYFIDKFFTYKSMFVGFFSIEFEKVLIISYR